MNDSDELFRRTVGRMLKTPPKPHQAAKAKASSPKPKKGPKRAASKRKARAR